MSFSNFWFYLFAPHAQSVYSKPRYASSSSVERASMTTYGQLCRGTQRM